MLDHSVPEIDELISAALETARSELSMEIGYFSEFVGPEQIIRGVEGEGATFGLTPGTTVPLADSYCQRVVDGRVSGLVPDVAAHPELAPLPVTGEAQIAAYVGVPLALPDGRLYGTLCCASHSVRPELDGRDLQFVRVLARMLAEHLQRRADEREFAMRLQRANAELESFAHVAAHDLTEPLRTVSGLAQLLVQRLKDDEMSTDTLEVVDHILIEAERMEAVVDDLLEHARAGGAADHCAVDLGPLTRAAIDAVRASAEAALARFEVAELPVVAGSPTQLRQLIQNLLANALKYPGEQPPVVRIDASRADDGWEIAVTDNGPGIPEHERERIFRPFVRLREGGAAQGTGLGLATCAKVVAAHGGRLRVEAASGGGSRFVFSLPSP